MLVYIIPKLQTPTIPFQVSHRSTFSQLRSTAAAAATDIQESDAGVVVAHLVVVVLPGVEVEVLILGRPLESRAHEHVVEGLGVLVEQVGVALGRGDVGHIIEVKETRDLLEDLEGLNLDEIVEVTGDDDAGGWILLEDLSNEVLLFGSVGKSRSSRT